MCKKYNLIFHAYLFQRIIKLFWDSRLRGNDMARQSEMPPSQKTFVIQIIFFNILKIFVSSHFQLVRSRFVADNNPAGMQLQGSNRPHLRNRAFHALRQSAGFAVSVCQNQNFPCEHDSSNANRERRFGNFLRIVAEKAGIGDNGIGRQRFDSRPGM